MTKKVMIADDASFMRQLIKDVLVKFGYEVVAEAESGEEAALKYQQTRPDVVTMDIVMKGENGIDAIKNIIKFDPQAKILVISAMGQQAMMVEAIQAGASGFVVKPFKAEMLLMEVKRVLGE